MDIDVMVTAELPTPAAYVFRAEGGNRLTRLAGLRPGGEMLLSPCMAYAIHHPSAGTLLIDTGMHPDANGRLRHDFGCAMSLVFGGLQPVREPFDEQLRALDIEPDAVEHVIMTHLHVDHTSGMRLLPGTEFICTRQEWAATRKRLAAGKGYIRHHLPSESRMRLIDFETDGQPFGPFAQTIDLLDDGSVRLISTPGHTVGHLSVLLRLKQGRQVLVVGDAAYTLRSIREELLPMLTADDEASLRSMSEIRAFAESDPGAILVPSHDPTAWHELRPVARSMRTAAAAPAA